MKIKNEGYTSYIIKVGKKADSAANIFVYIDDYLRFESFDFELSLSIYQKNIARFFYLYLPVFV